MGSSPHSNPGLNFRSVTGAFPCPVLQFPNSICKNVRTRAFFLDYIQSWWAREINIPSLLFVNFSCITMESAFNTVQNWFSIMRMLDPRELDPYSHLAVKHTGWPLPILCVSSNNGVEKHGHSRQAGDLISPLSPFKLILLSNRIQSVNHSGKLSTGIMYLNLPPPSKDNQIIWLSPWDHNGSILTMSCLWLAAKGKTF